MLTTAWLIFCMLRPDIPYLSRLYLRMQTELWTSRAIMVITGVLDGQGASHVAHGVRSSPKP
jgi:hypothetical protein